MLRQWRARREIFWRHGTHLVVTPGEHDIIKATVGLVDTIFRRIDAIARVWVCFERLWIYDFIRKFAADNECVLGCGKWLGVSTPGSGIKRGRLCAYPNDVPLTFGIEQEK